jgi:hypothetical protein
MNVDLDIVALAPLDGLVEAMGERVFVLHIGKRGRKYEAHVELASSHMGMPAHRTIMGLVSIVKKLPRRYRRIWDSAKSRDFNVGIEAGLEPHSYELRLDQRTIDAVAEVRGDLVVTVYAPDVNRPSVTLRPKGATVPNRPRRGE